MDSDDGESLQIPRLRVLRHSSPGVYSGENTPVAGPSRLSPNTLSIPAFNDYDDGDDDEAQATPRMTANGHAFRDVEPTSSVMTARNAPSTRLRDVLAMAPSSRTAPSRPPPRQPSPEPATPSEFDSDFDIPNSMSVAPSFAQESLKELFSRALRETPQKDRWRRNSIDASEVEQSPRLDRVAKQRVAGRSKRKSLSDDEDEKLNLSREPPPKFDIHPAPRLSSAATFDALRQRLNGSQIRISDLAQSTSSEATISSTDTATVLRQLDSSTSVPLQANSTPYRTSASMHMPSHMQSHSDLMGQDSEMHRIMDMDDYDTDQEAHFPFPASDAALGPNGAITTPPRRTSLSHMDSSPATAKITKPSSIPRMRRTSLDAFGSASNTGSPQSNRDQERERERRWNKPPTPSKPGTPERSYALTSAHLARHDGLGRRASYASPGSMSVDDDNSVRSRTTSLASGADSVRSKERGWNHPNPSLRPRNRTTSQPIFPGSPGSPWVTPERAGSTAGVSSRSSSRASLNNDHETAWPVVHERERNWGAPNPTWTHQSPGTLAPFSPHGSPSPITAVRARPRTGSMSGSPKADPGPSEVRFASTGKRTPLRHALSSPMMGGASPGSPSRLPMNAARSYTSPTPADRKSLVFPARPETPDSPDGPQTSVGLRRSPGDHVRLSSRFGWTFPRGKTILPPFETESSPEAPPRELPTEADALADQEELVPTRPTTPAEPPAVQPNTSLDDDQLLSPMEVPRPASQASLSVDTKRSHTPLLDAKLNGDVSPVSPRGTRGHKRTTTELNAAVGAIPPRVQNINKELAAATTSNAPRDEGGSQLGNNEGFEPVVDGHSQTPLGVDPTHSPILRSRTPPIPENELPRALPSPKLSIPIPDLPPAIESPDSPLSPAIPTTPPRRSSFSTSALQFRTPSPPKNLPDLPPPPSSDDEHTMDLRFETPRQNGVIRENGYATLDFSSMKTPRPPGAWAATPAPAAPPADRVQQPPETPVDWTVGSISSTSFNPQDMSSPPSAAPHLPSADDSELISDNFATPAASFVRPGANAAPTPAPPGAWLPTPGSARKSLYKVRFDVSESEMSAAEESHMPIARRALVDNSEDQQPVKAEVGAGELQVVAVATVNAPPIAPAKAEELIVNGLGLEHVEKIRKHRGLRVLDAFGQEQMEDLPKPESEAEPEPEVKIEAVQATPRSDKGKGIARGTPRSRSGMRMLDAMGRELEDDDSPGPESPSNSSLSEDDAPRSRAEALAIIRRNTADLRKDLREHGHIKPDILTPGDEDHAELQGILDESRSYREQLQYHLATASRTTDAADREYRAMKKRRESYMRRGGPTRIFINLLDPRVFCTLVALQLALIATFYRFADARALSLFRTRYHDPFNPDIYLNPIKPDLLRPSMTTTNYEPSLSLLAIPDSIRRNGWTGMVVEVGSNTSAVILDWQRSTWETWNTGAGQIATAWPPT